MPVGETHRLDTSKLPHAHAIMRVMQCVNNPEERLGNCMLMKPRPINHFGGPYGALGTNIKIENSWVWNEQNN